MATAAAAAILASVRPLPLPLLLVLAALLPAAEVRLQSPLATRWEIASEPGPRRVEVVLRIPEGAPADLGAGVFTADRDGRWWQTALPSPLPAGEHRFTLDLDGDAALAAEPGPAGGWNAARRTGRVGVFLWSAQASRMVVGVDLRAKPAAPPAHAARLVDLVPDPPRAAVGTRWSVALRPEPMPADPADPALFDLRLAVREPDGTERELPGFWREPMAPRDRGDREDMVPAGAPRFEVRFRPRLPGTHHLELRARWAGGRTARAALPDLMATGAPGDGIVRVDPGDHRFFAVDGRMWWPVGLNLNNTFDTRSRDSAGTVLTPARGTLTYAAILDRLAAAGGDATEIWMSAWNLGLAWRADWPGFDGLRGLNLANAERLDRVLDHAWERGIRVNLVLNNHGQASPRTDREWKDSPLNAANGGPCVEPGEVFTDPRALAWQDRVRRYIVARWADHPAVMGWKLWSEINLTAGTSDTLRAWHERAAADLAKVDAYHHPVTTHWAGDYRRVDPRVAELPGMDYLCIDAYRRARGDADPIPLSDVLAGTLTDPNRGLQRFAKPVLVTEYGASSSAGSEDFREVDHRTGGWIGLVSGHAGAPMLWWWEWVDQTGRWAPYGALRRFIAGEDLRGAEARTTPMEATAPAGRLWSRAWIRPGRVLGYLLEPRWGAVGGEAPRIAGAAVGFPADVAPGRIRVQWWDAEAGAVVREDVVEHRGGGLSLAAPDFAGHLAFKLWRE